MRHLTWPLIIVGSFATASVGIPPKATATIIYQSIPDLTVPPISGHCSECTDNGQRDNQQIGQQFTLGQAEAIASVKFNVGNAYFWPSPVTVSVYQDGAGSLGTQLYANTFSSFASDLTLGPGVDLVGVNTPGLDLGPGTYDILFTNPDHLALAVYFMPPQQGYEIIVDGDIHSPPLAGDIYAPLAGIGTNIGIQLDSEPVRPPRQVPEPTSLSLFAVALIGFGAARRFSRPTPWR
jgi:PEP-CTERM motif